MNNNNICPVSQHFIATCNSTRVTLLYTVALIVQGHEGHGHGVKLTRDDAFIHADVTLTPILQASFQS